MPSSFNTLSGSLSSLKLTLISMVCPAPTLASVNGLPSLSRNSMAVTIGGTVSRTNVSVRSSPSSTPPADSANSLTVTVMVPSSSAVRSSAFRLMSTAFVSGSAPGTNTRPNVTVLLPSESVTSTQRPPVPSTCAKGSPVVSSASVAPSSSPPLSSGSGVL